MIVPFASSISHHRWKYTPTCCFAPFRLSWFKATSWPLSFSASAIFFPSYLYILLTTGPDRWRSETKWSIPKFTLFGCSCTTSSHFNIDRRSEWLFTDWKARRLSVTGATSGVGLCEWLAGGSPVCRCSMLIERPHEAWHRHGGSWGISPSRASKEGWTGWGANMRASQRPHVQQSWDRACE